jgi:hypothetical protein
MFWIFLPSLHPYAELKPQLSSMLPAFLIIFLNQMILSKNLLIWKKSG